MNEFVIYTLQLWKKKFDQSMSDQEAIEVAKEFFNDHVPVILNQLIKDDAARLNLDGEPGETK